VLAALAENGHVSGVRAIVSWHPDPSISRVMDRHLMMNKNWRAGLSFLESLDLSLDLLMSPWQVDDASDLFSSFPGIRFAINHCGSPFERSADGMAEWANGLKQLADAPNAVLKVSDLVAYDPDWSEESLTVVSRACLAAFGARRCMLGSDHPVATLHATFHQVYDHFRRAFSDLSHEEQFALFAGNATEFYRMPKIAAV
jgi:predicted TIM-barrel fold metal-dependent hydrolase